LNYLLYLFRRSRVFLLFVLLELIAFALILQQRSYHRSWALNSSQELTGLALNRYQNSLQYLSLREQNQILHEENRKLRNLLDANYLYSHRGLPKDSDTLLSRRFQWIPARVIQSSIFKRNNYLTLDKGRLSGVYPGMGIHGTEGVVGIVQQVGAHFCTALPLINPNLQVTGKLQRSGYFGPVRWDGKDYRYAFLEDIPRYAPVNLGDTAVSDGRSALFPAGLPIGYVVAKELQTDQNFYRLKLELSVDFARLERVYLLNDLKREELDSLRALQ